jgi:serine/threonine protein kinase
VALLDASLTDAHGPCLVLEHVRGVDLERLLRRHRRFSPERAGRWLGQLCEVLQAAHAQGILHHDLKPANVMIVDPDTPLERIKVMDFGLAKLAASPHLRLEQLRRTEAAAVATGTVEYLPPEQARGDTPDHRGDLYSVGVMLFELLTGRLPFARPGVAETLQAHAHEPPPAFADVGAAGWVAPAVEAVVRTCLAKYPVERPQSAWELAQRYEQALGRKVLAADGPAPAGPPPKPRTDLKSGRKLDLNSLSYELDAVMPEPMAAAKLRGFVEDVGGEVVASEPGLVRVLLGGGRCAYQLAAAPPRGPAGLGRLVGGSRPVLIEMELHMVKPDPAQPDRLHLTVLLRPLGGAAPVPAAQWRACADRIHADLRAYLMS